MSLYLHVSLLVDSNKSKSLSKGTTFDQNENSDKASRHSMESAQSASTEPNGAVDHYAGRHSENGAKIEEKRGTNGENEDTKSEEDQELRHGISSIKFDGTEVNEIEDRQKYGTDHLNRYSNVTLYYCVLDRIFICCKFCSRTEACLQSELWHKGVEYEFTSTYTRTSKVFPNCLLKRCISIFEIKCS